MKRIMKKKYQEEMTTTGNDATTSESEILQMASSSMIHSTSTSSSRSCKYDVFLSFRGGDVRQTFIDHLYFSLEYHLIATFKDDVKLPRGEPIRQSLFDAIEDSYIALVIFSKNYADSSWCLDELTHIMKCKEERGLFVIPIFYDVDTSDVRKQKNDFGAAFAKQEAENDNKAQSWRNALVEASNNSGLEPKYVANGLETKVIKEIIDTLMIRLYHLKTNFKTSGVEDFVGMTTRVQELMALLNIGSDDVHMVGIWGIGGGGKTTLANSIRAEVAKYFHGVCTIENVREETTKGGLTKLQEKVLLSLFKTNVHVQSVTEGMDMIKGMACRRKVLLVLDDVSDLGQLEALAGKHDWFGHGSRIIITTRDEHLLITHKVDVVHKVKLLLGNEAIQLFDRYAYNEKAPIEDYRRLSLHVVSKADGLPLALKVFGSFLYDKTTDELMEALDTLKVIPNVEIVQMLKFTYDGLEHDVQELFLDLACFFIGCWEVERMCFGDATMENYTIEAIQYQYDRSRCDLGNKSSHFYRFISNMKKLRYLKVHLKNGLNDRSHHELENKSSQFWRFISNMKKLIQSFKVHMKNGLNVQGPSFLSNELQYIEWCGYPGASSFPDTFQPRNLGYLQLEESMQTHLWNGSKDLRCLKKLKLVKMHVLASTPDFKGLPSLQELVIDECKELEEIHSSLGNHTCVEEVRIWMCEKLKMFPTIVNMKSLKSLQIVQCYKIIEFPMIHSNMESLESLCLICIGIAVLPSSIEGRCPNLRSLKLFSLPNLKSIQFNINAFQHLKWLMLDATCHSNDEEIPHGVSNALLANLQELCLLGCSFSRLDFSIAQHTELKLLNLSYCKNLNELSELPSSLNILIVNGCESLVTLGDCYRNCARLCYISVHGGRIISDGDKLLDFMLQACMSIENHSMILRLEGVMEKVAKGVHDGSSFGPILELPENWRDGFSGFLISAIFKTKHNPVMDVLIEMKELVSGMDSGYDVLRMESDDDGSSDMYLREWTWVGYVSFASITETKWWNISTHKTIQFHIQGDAITPDGYNKILPCRGLQVQLVERRNTGTSLEYETSTSSSQYAPKVIVVDDSESALTIGLRDYIYSL